MTLIAPLWQQNNSYSAEADRALVTTLLQPGVAQSGDLAVTERAAGANLSVDVAPGTVVVEGTEAGRQGYYVCVSTSTVNVPLDAAPPSGQSRLDVIVAQVRDGAYSGSLNDWTITKVTGTPTTGTPLWPDLPASSL